MTHELLGTVRDAWPYVASALLALGLGPLLYRFSRAQPALMPALDGFVLVSVGGLVTLFLLPRSIDAIGIWAIAAVLAGLAIPTLVERFGGIAHGRVHAVGLVIALVGLLLHTVLDGMALVGGGDDEHEGGLLALAVVLHRLPVGVAVWWLVRPAYGVRAALLVLALIAGGTFLGVFFGAAQIAGLEGNGVALFQALVAGTLLHVVLHGAGGPAPGGTERGRRLAQGMGGLAGAAVVLAVPGHGHEDGLARYGERFLELALDSAPALLLGYALAGVVVVALPRAPLDWLKGGGAFREAARGMAFGIPIPVCSCGVVPVYQGLIQKGAPAAAAMAFLVATPELGVESILLSLPLLGGELTAARLIAAMIVALVVGWLVGRTVAPAPGPARDDGAPEARRPLLARAQQALRHGLGEVVDDTGAWILLGLAIAAAVEPSSLAPLLASLPKGADVLVAALIGLPIYVCASGATPIAAALLFAGMSPGAALAFLLAGPATNVTTFGVLSAMHGRRVALAFGASVIAASVGLGLVVNAVLQPPGGPAAPPVVDDGTGPLAVVALVLVGAAFLASFLRLGPRGFLEPVVRVSVRGHDDEHGHDHHEHAEHAEHDETPAPKTGCGSCGCGH